VGCEPLGFLLPDHAPEAVHDAALGADHVKVALPPLATVLGFAVKLKLGALALIDTVVDWAAVPPEPEHVKV